ncbi:hypothetical protein ATK17_3901 [Branchiibius hedensis]|uniref:Centromere-binding protein ParB C-terminal domain-containing protein n=1 Tax=Branchiibius hedensis TaxID=672460 RepID=A0A2Y9CAX5_9MICO|nr:hypothetical protein [Branchiibius hedensis]PWJ23010.1 hypothetical protein ATK17_3901 [Branchiibius hedensis]SSA59086.1 hypothetical protein SAMN04489750_3901 [Branchiibius hedensis]
MNRPAPRKSTLAGSTPVAPPPAPETAAAPAPSAPKRAVTKTSSSATAPRKAVAAAADTTRIGIYLTPAEFDNAKAAYLADWTNGGEADTFGRWIGAAIDTYAARTPKQRSGAQPRGRADERTGATRSFLVPTEILERMRAAITADRSAGRWPSDSAWCGEAIAYSVEEARDRNGGDLPTPPPRLPNRLVR